MIQFIQIEYSNTLIFTQESFTSLLAIMVIISVAGLLENKCFTTPCKSTLQNIVWVKIFFNQLNFTY